MPEYLAPGAYAEEISPRPRPIEGVSTATTGFVGPTRFGPAFHLSPDDHALVTSLEEFERLYGDGGQLDFVGEEEPSHNYMWHAARAFFAEGGKRLYVARVFTPSSASHPSADSDDATTTATTGEDGRFADGYARATVPGGTAAADADEEIRIRARFPGAAGNLGVRFTLSLGEQNMLGLDPETGEAQLGDSLRRRDVVWIQDAVIDPAGGGGGGGAFYLADSYIDEATGQRAWRFLDDSLDPASALPLSALVPAVSPDPARGPQVRVASITVTVTPAEGGGDHHHQTFIWQALALDPAHPDSFSEGFNVQPNRPARAHIVPVVIMLGDNLTSGLAVLRALLLGARNGLLDHLTDPRSGEAERSFDVRLAGGNDGRRPTAEAYEGSEGGESGSGESGLKSFEDLGDISIVAAPGSTFRYEEDDYRADSARIISLLVSHAERMRYRVAVLDCGDVQTVAQVRALRSRIDSSYATLYYPWIRVLDPVTNSEITLPPSGFVAGIYARTDAERGAHKAPANEVVRLAIGLEALVNRGEQDILNPEGINCIRHFEGRGFRVWGARTAATSDTEWKYVNLRRYFAYLERSISLGTRWAVFEPNNATLWGNLRRAVSDFLYREWRTAGALLGDKPDRAFFVRCDPTTMTQDDLNRGRLVCLIGVAALRPAEFVILRIGQWTADRK